MDPLPAPKCPRCGAELELGSNGQLDFWSCPAGHGLGLTVSEAYERLQNDEIAKIWHDSDGAPAGEHACPMCGLPMVNVTVGVDAKSNGKRVALDVCREDELFWFDAGELDAFPQHVPDPGPSPEEQKKIDLVLSAFDKNLEEGLEAEADRGVLNKLTSRLVRRHPGFAHVLDHMLYGDKLEELERETEAQHEQLEAEWEGKASAPEHAS